MNDDWEDNQQENEEGEPILIEIDPMSSLLFLLTDLAYDAAKSVLCLGIWNLALVKWFTFLPCLTYWKMFLLVLFFNIILSGRLND